MRSSRSKVATAIVLVSLGGLTGVALSSTPDKPKLASVSPLDIRTDVIRRTVHRTRSAGGAGGGGGHPHVLGRRVSGSASPAPRFVAVSSPPRHSSSGVRTRSSGETGKTQTGHAPTPATRRTPVTTKTSGEGTPAGASPPNSSGNKPVSTSASGSQGGGGNSGGGKSDPVKTSPSGGGGDDGENEHESGDHQGDGGGEKDD